MLPRHKVCHLLIGFDMYSVGDAGCVYMILCLSYTPGKHIFEVIEEPRHQLPIITYAENLHLFTLHMNGSEKY